MASFEFLAIILTGLGLTVSIVYYASVLSNQNKTRRAQLLMEIYAEYRSPNFRKRQNMIINQEWIDFDDFWEKYGSIKNPDAWAKWQSSAAFYNGIGVLLKKGLIDIDLVEELLVNVVIIAWHRMGPILKGWRENIVGIRFGEGAHSSKYETLSGFDYLYNELKKRDPSNFMG